LEFSVSSSSGNGTVKSAISKRNGSRRYYRVAGIRQSNKRLEAAAQRCETFREIRILGVSKTMANKTKSGAV
jgi:hypothetical protein